MHRMVRLQPGGQPLLLTRIHGLNMLAHASLRLVAVVMAWSAFPAIASDAPSRAKAAAAFATTGMSPTLATCRLPTTCNHQRLIALSKGIRETGNDNLVDERQLKLRGLELSLLYILGNNALPPEKRRFPHPYAHPYILSLMITSANWPVRHGLKVGTARAAVEKVLGKSGDGGPDECVHCADDATQDEVTICYARRKVHSIQWQPWWDG